jgi:hypothetical protein
MIKLLATFAALSFLAVTTIPAKAQQRTTPPVTHAPMSVPMPPRPAPVTGYQVQQMQQTGRILRGTIGNQHDRRW